MIVKCINWLIFVNTQKCKLGDFTLIQQRFFGWTDFLKLEFCVFCCWHVWLIVFILYRNEELTFPYFWEEFPEWFDTRYKVPMVTNTCEWFVLMKYLLRKQKQIAFLRIACNFGPISLPFRIYIMLYLAIMIRNIRIRLQRRAVNFICSYVIVICQLNLLLVYFAI